MERRLTAILHADVAGYSRLTGTDDEGTVETLKIHLGVLTEAIQGYGGRIVNTAGDAVLAEFVSVVTALKCAVAAQRELAKHNKELPANRRLEFRAGVNLGDVVVDGEEIYGDGVNVAARLECLADPGGICISGRVQEQVEDKLEVGFGYLGAQAVKNIKKPVNVYKVLLDPEAAGKVIDLQEPKPPRWQWPVAAAVALLILTLGAFAQWQRPGPPEFERASIEQMAFPLPEKPSIAVLPFDNLSGDPDQEFLADGLSEDITTTLSRIPELFVIARNSTATYIGKPVKVQQVAEELGVQYVLEGSVQKSGDRLRVTAQLIDALSGRHLWADRYDRKIQDLFALQDEISYKVLIELQVKLTSGEHARVASRGTNSLEAWLLRNQAFDEVFKYTKEGVLKARDLLWASAKADPKYARAWAGVAATYRLEADRGGWLMSREQALEMAFEYAERAIEVDPQEPQAYQQLAFVLLSKGQHEQALELAEQGAALAPNDFQSIAILAVLTTYGGDAKRGIELFELANRLSPRYPPSIDSFLGMAYHVAGEDEKAIPIVKKAIAGAPEVPFARAFLICIYLDLGRVEEARAEVAELLKVAPDTTVASVAARFNFKDRALRGRFLENLQKAGLPE